MQATTIAGDGGRRMRRRFEFLSTGTPSLDFAVERGEPGDLASGGEEVRSVRQGPEVAAAD